MNNIKRDLEAYNLINEHGNIKVIKGMIQVLQETEGDVEIIWELKQLLKEALKNKIEQQYIITDN